MGKKIPEDFISSIKIFLLLSIVATIVCSCKQGTSDNSLYGNADVAIVTENRSAEITFDSTKEIEQSNREQTATIELNILPSSSKIIWEKNYNEVLNDLFSDSVFKKMFDTEINFNDLKRVNCPQFNKLSFERKKLFFTVFMAAISEAESDFENDQKTWNRSDRTMNIGLLQIDHASADRHAGNFFNKKFTDDDLKDPEWNLKAGAFILRNQLTNSRTIGRLFPPSVYYWEVLLGESKRVLTNIKTNLGSVCTL